MVVLYETIPQCDGLHLGVLVCTIRSHILTKSLGVLELAVLHDRSSVGLNIFHLRLKGLMGIDFLKSAHL